LAANQLSDDKSSHNSNPAFKKTAPERPKKELVIELLLKEKPNKYKGQLLKGTLVAKLDTAASQSNHNLNLKGVKLRANLLDVAEQKKLTKESQNDELKKVIEKVNKIEALETEALEMEVKKRMQYLNQQIEEQKDIATNIRSKSNGYANLRRTNSWSSFSTTTQIHSKKTSNSEWNLAVSEKKNNSLQGLLQSFSEKSITPEAESPLLLAETRVMEALTRKLQIELDKLNEKMKKIKDYQSKKKLMLDLSKTSKTMALRNIREKKGLMPGLQNKERTLIHFLKDSWKALFTKENIRNQKLRQLALTIQSRYNRQHVELRHNIEDTAAIKEEMQKNSLYLKENVKSLAFDVRQLTDDIQYLTENMEKLSARRKDLKMARNSKIQEMVIVDSTNYQKDILLLERALERRRAAGIEIKSIQELDVLDLQDCALEKVRCNGYFLPCRFRFLKLM
jgi:hypothetical protein